MFRPLLPALLLWGASAHAAPPSIPPEQGLLQADEAMNQDITEQGNDIHAMLTRTGDPDVSYSTRSHAFFNLHEIYKRAPLGRTPGNIQFLHTEYVTLSASGDIGIAYGAWDTETVDDSTKFMPVEFYKYLVFGFNDGLWTSKWSPRGAPRLFYIKYLRVWQRSPVDGIWRLVGGPYFATMAPEPLVSTTPAVMDPPHPLQAKVDASTAQAEAFAADAEFSKTSQHAGLRAAYLGFGANDMRLVIRGQEPLVGIAAIEAKTIPDTRHVTLHPQGSIVAADGDMVFTYGLGYAADDPLHTKQPVLYAHAWRHGTEGWRLCVALVDSWPGP